MMLDEVLAIRALQALLILDWLELVAERPVLLLLPSLLGEIRIVEGAAIAQSSRIGLSLADVRPQQVGHARALCGLAIVNASLPAAPKFGVKLLGVFNEICGR